MNGGIHIKNGIIIPENEIEITVSRSGGPGGQHVNKTESRVTVRWNVKHSLALGELQKERIITNLGSRITVEGDIIVHNSESRSQMMNRQKALEQFASLVRKALFVPKKRMKTTIPTKVQEERLRAKTIRSAVKKLRRKKIEYE